jgi:polyisoprenoid-binding protein YceI
MVYFILSSFLTSKIYFHYKNYTSPSLKKPLMRTYIFSVIAMVAVPFASFGQTKWQQTSGSVTATVKNMGSTVTCRFAAPKTTLAFSPDKPGSSSLKGSVPVNSINTGIKKRDKDLQSENYFDAAKHPLIEVASTKLTAKGGTFNVTIKGVTKPVEIPFTFTQSGNMAEWKGSFTINRRDFGVGGKSGLASMMSDDIHVAIDVKAKK